MAVRHLGERLWWETLMDRKALGISRDWDVYLWRWNRHCLERMIDRDIVVNEVVDTINNGCWVRQKGCSRSWRVKWESFVVIVCEHWLDMPAIAPSGVVHDHSYHIVTAWRVGDANSGTLCGQIYNLFT